MRRALRIALIGGAVFALLVLRFDSGIWPENEATPAIPFALLPIALLFALGAFGLETSGRGSVARRDGLWGLAAALATFSILKLVSVV